MQRISLASIITTGGTQPRANAQNFKRRSPNMTRYKKTHSEFTLCPLYEPTTFGMICEALEAIGRKLRGWFWMWLPDLVAFGAICLMWWGMVELFIWSVSR